MRGLVLKRSLDNIGSLDDLGFWRRPISLRRILVGEEVLFSKPDLVPKSGAIAAHIISHCQFTMANYNDLKYCLLVPSKNI